VENIDQPMKHQGGLEKEATHYEDLYSALIDQASTVFQDDYAETCEPEHVHATNKLQTRILDASRGNPLLLTSVETLRTRRDGER
jgi:hypothetical protein